MQYGNRLPLGPRPAARVSTKVGGAPTAAALRALHSNKGLTNHPVAFDRRAVIWQESGSFLLAYFKSRVKSQPSIRRFDSLVEARTFVAKITGSRVKVFEPKDRSVKQIRKDLVQFLLYGRWVLARPRPSAASRQSRGGDSADRAAVTEGDSGLSASVRVVVVWIEERKRYLVCGNKGSHVVGEVKECTDPHRYNLLLSALAPIDVLLIDKSSDSGTRLCLDLCLNAGKLFRPKSKRHKQPPVRGAGNPNRMALQLGGLMQKQRGDLNQQHQSVGALRSNKADIRIEVPITAAARERRAAEQRIKLQALAREDKRAAARKLRREQWLKARRLKERPDRDDMMGIALQGGSPGLGRR